MAFSINFLKHDAVVGSTPWGGTFESAKQHARDHLMIHANTGGATRVEVRDEAGKLLFGHPRTLHA